MGILIFCHLFCTFGSGTVEAMDQAALIMLVFFNKVKCGFGTHDVKKVASLVWDPLFLAFRIPQWKPLQGHFCSNLKR
jgi:hypothetical protein